MFVCYDLNTIQNQFYSAEIRFLKSYCNSLYIFIISILYICLHPLIVTCNCTSECKALPACVNEVMCWCLKGVLVSLSRWCRTGSLWLKFWIVCSCGPSSWSQYWALLCSSSLSSTNGQTSSSPTMQAAADKTKLRLSALSTIISETLQSVQIKRHLLTWVWETSYNCNGF